MRPVLQPGNEVRVTWRARLDEHLGHYVVEGLRLRAGEFMIAAHTAYGVTHLAALCRLLPERDPHAAVYAELEDAVTRLGDAHLAARLVVRFELMLLAELGFGLDLSECAATGLAEDLVYVSPKSGRAVSRSAGEPWRERLLRLPAFLGDEPSDHVPSAEDISAGFALTGHFFTRHVLEPRGQTLPDARERFIAACAAAARAA
jgi:DNA repair protein RecO (recombination protein O)